MLPLLSTTIIIIIIVIVIIINYYHWQANFLLFKKWETSGIWEFENLDLSVFFERNISLITTELKIEFPLAD